MGRIGDVWNIWKVVIGFCGDNRDVFGFGFLGAFSFLLLKTDCYLRAKRLDPGGVITLIT